MSKNKRLSHLNGLVKLWNIRKDLESDLRSPKEDVNIKDGAEDSRTETIAWDQSLHLKELLLCLRVPLINESSEIRASTLRAIRLLLTEPEHVNIIQEINLHYLIARSLDIDLDNKIERIQAIKLIRRLSQVSLTDIPISLARAVVALVEGGPSEGDRLYRASLCICCELSILHSELFLKVNGVSALTHALLDCSSSRMIESILGCLTALHNDPETRLQAQVQLGIIVAPFTEFRYVHSAHTPGVVLGPGPGPGPGGGYEIGKDQTEERLFRFQCAETAIISMLRSWPGLLQMTEPGAKNGVSHLQALIDILYLENSYVRKKILILLYDVLNIRAPNDVSTFTIALEAINPSSFREHWKLAEDFVAGEGFDILPRLAKSRPNLLESHIGFILGSLLKTELPDALIKVIVNADSDDLSILATILLGEILHLAYTLLPRELNATSHCLPALLAEVSSSDAFRSNRASEAVDALHRHHDIKRRGPLSNSLFLNQIMTGSSRSVGRESFIGDRLHLPANWSQLLKHEPAANDRINSSIRDSQVNNVTIDPDTDWNWDLITSVFKWPSATFKSMDNLEYKNFVKKVVEFYKPSENKFSLIELKLPSGKHNKRSRFLAKTGCYVLDFLVSDHSIELSKMLDNFLSDVKSNFQALIDAASTHDCFLSPTRVATTTCQFYFLFIGRLSRSEIGRQSLDKNQILQVYTLMLSLRSDIYLKLVISSLDYSAMDWGSRILLSKALTKEESESCRLYATRFLGVLIRSRTSNVAQWGISLLVSQLFDASQTVAWVALHILEDACDDKMNLEAVVCAIKTRHLTDLNHLGLKGILLYTRFLSSNNGFEFLSEKDDGMFLKKELERWHLELNVRYVSLIEELLNDGLSRHQLNETRNYGRRSRENYSTKDVFVPPHLYGQLALTPGGLEILVQEKSIIDMIKHLVNLCNMATLSNGTMNDSCGFIGVNKKDWTLVKSAIWATAHISSSSIGAKWVDNLGGIAALINVAEKCNVYSLRGSAFYALGLVATNKYGCQLLSAYGWCSLRYGRNEQSPIMENWFQSNVQHFGPLGDILTPDKMIDEESDAVCSSLGTSFSEPEPALRLSSEPPSETYWGKRKISSNTKKHQLQSTPEREHDEPADLSITSQGKRGSWLSRSFSFGKEDMKEKMEFIRTRAGKGKQPEKRSSFSLPKKFKGIGLSKLQAAKSPPKNVTKSTPLAVRPDDGSNTTYEHQKTLNADVKNDKTKQIPPEAPFATPEESSDGCSDVGGSSAPLGNIKEETLACTNVETSSFDKPSSYKDGGVPCSNSPDLQMAEDISHTMIVRAEVSNPNILDDTSLEVPTAISQNECVPMSSANLFTKKTSLERKVLSPIASSTSISAMGVPTDEINTQSSTIIVSMKDQDTPIKSNYEKETKEDAMEGSCKRELLNSPSSKAVPIATARSTPRPLPPVPFRRTGKRAFSESEAQNFSLITRNTTNIPTSLAYWTGDRSTRSEHNYAVTHKGTVSTCGPKISLISGSQQGATYAMEPQLSGLCTSVTSVSSSGSWAENPGKKIVDSLRKRPQLLDNDTLNNIEGISKPLPVVSGNIALGQDYSRHNQKPMSGLFTKSEGRSSSGTLGNSGTFGVGRRRDSLSQKFQSLDYRLKLKYHLNSRGQGKYQHWANLLLFLFPPTLIIFNHRKLLFFIGSDGMNTGGCDSGEDNFSTNQPFHHELTRNSLVIKSVEPTQGVQEPAYWGVTFPTRIESLFSSPHLAPISRSVSKEESIKSLLDDEGKKN